MHIGTDRHQLVEVQPLPQPEAAVCSKYGTLTVVDRPGVRGELG
jgi:hypothetical protein